MEDQQLESVIAKRDAYYNNAISLVTEYPHDPLIESNLLMAAKYNLDVRKKDTDKKHALSPELEKVLDLVTDMPKDSHEKQEIISLATKQLWKAHYSSIIDQNYDAAVNAVKKAWPDDLIRTYVENIREAQSKINRYSPLPEGSLDKDQLKDATLQILDIKTPDKAVDDAVIFLKKELSADKPQAMSISPRDINIALAILQNERAV